MSSTKKLVSLLLSVSLLLQAVPQQIVSAKSSLLGGTSGGDGNTPTTEVTLLTGSNLPEGMAEKVKMPMGSSVPVGTKVGEISAPDLPGYVFEGWYYDPECTDYAYPNDEITEETTLYASFTDRQLTRGDEDFLGNYAATMDLKDLNFKFRVTNIAPGSADADAEADSVEYDLSKLPVEWSVEDIENSVILRDQNKNERIRMVVTDNGDGTFDIAALDGFEPGKVYQLDVSGADGLYIVAEGVTQPETVIYHNMSIYREEVMDLALEDGIIYIPAEKVSKLGELEPLMTVELTDLSEPFEGMTALEEAVARGAINGLISEEESRVAKEGSFVYKAPASELPKVGDMVCIYTGTCPSEAVGDMDNFLNEDKASYMVIDKITNQYTFEYHLADPIDVLDTPVVVPFSMSADLQPDDGNCITLPADAFIFDADETLPFTIGDKPVTYGSMKLDKNTVVEAGDYLSLYMLAGNNVTESNMESPTLLRIKEIAVSENLGDDYIDVSYSAATMEELQETMQVHAKQNYDVSEEFIEEHKDEVSRLAQREFEELDKTPLLKGVLQDEGVKEDLMAHGIDPTTTFVVDENGNLLNLEMLDFDAMGLDFSSDEKLLGSAEDDDMVEAELKELYFDTDFYNGLTHFHRSGIGFNASVRGKVEVSMKKFTLVNPFSEKPKEEGQGKINIEFSLAFTQELFLDEHFDIDVDWWGPFPTDIEAGVAIDVGSWSNVTSNLKVYTGFEDDPFDMGEYEPSAYTEKYMDAIKNINEKLIPTLKDYKEHAEWDLDIDQGDYIPWEADDKSIVEHIQGDEDDDPTPKPKSLGAFEEAYKKIVDGVDDTWMQIMKLSLMELKHSFLGIVCVKLEMGLTLNICGTVEIGMEYNYDYVRRYSATFDLDDLSFRTSSTDIQRPHSTFSLYAIGVFGFKPAIYLELAVGLLDTDLDSVSITVEAGLKFMLFLYGYLNIDNWKDDSVQFQGGVYLDEQFVLDISLGAQVGKGAFGTSKQIYGLEVPLTSLGSRFQIRGMASDPTGDEDEDGNPICEMRDSVEVYRTVETKNGFSFEIPPEDRRIFALDMRTGDVVAYYPEPEEFKYEILGDNKLVEYSVKEQQEGKVGKGVINGFLVKGKPYGFDPLKDDQQEFYRIKNAEIVSLDFAQNKRMPKFTVDIKMTYIPPKGVMIKGRQYTKILHYTVDQTSLGYSVSYPNSFYNQDLGSVVNQRDGRFDVTDYMPGVAMQPNDIPWSRPVSIPGYTFTGWKYYKPAYKWMKYPTKCEYSNLFEDYIYSVYEKMRYPDYLTAKFPYPEEAYGIDWAWFPVEEDEAKSYFVEEDGQTYLYDNLRMQMTATANPQKLKVRHYLINPDGTGYDLIAENDSFMADGIKSDVKYGGYELYKWGVTDAFNEDDATLAYHSSSHWYAEVETENKTRNTLKYCDVSCYRPPDDYETTVITATDSETAVDTVDVYFTERTDFMIHYSAVDENGNPIAALKSVAYESIWNGAKCQLKDSESINSLMYGYEFDGWYDTSEFDALSSNVGDPAGTKRMPLHDIHVYFKVKSLPLTVDIRFVCDEHGNELNSCQIDSFGGDSFTNAELMQRERKDGKGLVGDLFTSDRKVVDTSVEHHIGGMINNYVIGRTSGGLRAVYLTKTVRLTESDARPEGLNIRVVFRESKEKHLVEGEDYIYAVYDFGTTKGCNDNIADMNTNGLSIETAPYPAGYHVNGFSHEWDVGPYAYHTWSDDFYIPPFMPSHLEESDWTHYDAETNTLTYTFYSWLDAQVKRIHINHWLEFSDGRKTRYEMTEVLAATDEVVDIFPQYLFEPIGCVTNYEKTPKQVTMRGDVDVMEVDYYLKPASYKYQFVVKHPETGEVLYTSKTFVKSNHETFSLPAELRADTKANDALNLPGYQFIGWNCPENGYWYSQPTSMSGKPSGGSFAIGVTEHSAGTYEAVFDTIDAKITLYWENGNLMSIKDGKYSTRFDNAMRTIRTHTDFTLPEPKMYDGAVFAGWYDNPEFSGSPITGTQQITENAVYYAKVIPAFTVSFAGNGDEKTPCDYFKTVQQSQGQPYVYPSYMPGRNNYTFLGWSTTPNGTVNITADSKASTECKTLYAVWKPNEYKVMFDLNGGTWEQPEYLTHIYGESTTTLPTAIPTKTGYRFVGWQRGIGDPVLAEDISFAPYDLNYSIILYAVWEAETYSIFYDVQGGTMPTGAVSEWSYEKSATISAVPTMDDALFVGWYETATPNDTDTRVRRIDASHSAGDVTLYAKWRYQEYPISALYYSSNGEYIAPSEDGIPESYKVTDSIFTLPTPASTDVWTFKHWEIIDADGTATTVTKIDFSKYSGKIVLHAVFDKITYNITYDFNGGAEGTGTYLSTASIGESVYVPTPVRTGYRFWGWESEEVDKVANNFTMIGKAVTLKAKWRTESGQSAEDEAQYQIKYYISDGEDGWTLVKTTDAQTTYESVLSVGMMNSEYAGNRLYQFDHATVDGSSTEYGYYDDLPVTAGELNVYGIYYAYQEFTVHYMNEHGSGSVFQTAVLHYNDVVTAPATNPTKKGYTFGGWDFDFTAEKTVADLVSDISSDIYIYPKDWTQIKHNITYVNWPAGDENPNPATFTEDSSDFRLILPYRKGYTAKEQIVELSGKTEDITVTIEWEINTYEISYDLQGGTVLSALPTSYTVETEPQGLAVPLKEGYNFDGWTVAGSNDVITAVPFGDELVSMKLKANWTPITYRIIYNLDGGTPAFDLETAPITSYTYDDIHAGKVHELYYLEKEGYTFDGWDVLDQKTGGHAQVGTAGIFILPQTGSDLYIKAVFHMTSCNISYDLNDSSDAEHPANNPNWISSFNPSTDAGLMILEPTRTGYVFDGWTCNQKIGSYEAGQRMQSIYLDITNALPNVKLTAHWKAKPYYITYHLNGGSLETTNQITVTKNEDGEWIPESGTVNNPKVYSILNAIALEDPTRDDGIAFLGWTSEQFSDYADFTGCELTAAEKQALFENKPISTATVVKLLNCAALSNYTVHLENLKSGGLVLNAVWADEVYPIYYNLNGGSLPEGSANPETYTNLTDSFTLVNPVRTGYVFLGWTIGTSEELLPTVTVEKGSYGELDLTANWKVGKFTVSYELNGGNANIADAMTEFNMTDTVITFVTAARANSTFAYWTVKNADTGEILDDHVTGNVIVVPKENPCNLLVIANWNSEKGMAYADLDGGEWLTTVDGVTQDTTILYPMDTGATIVMLDPEKTGYDFMGWENLSEYDVQCTESEVEGCHNIVIPAGTSSNGIQLKAIWQANDDTEYQVSCFVRRTVDEDYRAMSLTKKYYGTAWEELSMLQLIEDVSAAEDVAFMAIAVDGTMVNATDPVIISGDHTTEIYLYFENNIHTVDFVKGISLGYIRGEQITKPDDPEWYGHTFDGWFANEACNIPFDFENAVMGTENITVYSRWIDNTIEIEYVNWPEEIENPNPTSFVPGSGDFYVVYPALDPNTTGYDYGGLTEEELAKYSYVNTSSTEKVTIETPFTLHNFTITYDLPTTFESTFIDTQVDSFNCKESVTLPTLSATGYTFIGWTATVNGEPFTLVDNTIPVGTMGDVILTAEFDSIVYEITYDGLEGSSFAETNPNPLTYLTENTPITFENPEKDGYTFLGWSTNGSDLSNPFVLEEGASGELALTAKWTAELYTIEVQDGATLNYTIEDTTSENGVVLMPEELYGYNFTGWTVTDETGLEISVDADNKLPAGTFGNLTAVANYEEISFQVSYELDGGSMVTDGTYPETYTIFESALVSDPEKDGYTFLGWMMQEESGSQIMMGAEGISGVYGDITLIACWEENGGSGDDPDANVFLVDANSNEIASFAFEIGEEVTMEKLVALLPDGYTYVEIVSAYGEAFEPFTVEEYGYYSFIPVKGYATVTLTATDGTRNDIATLYNDGKHMLDAEIGVGVETTLTGYRFDGWYDAADTAFTNCLSDSEWYNFIVTEDVSLVAKYTYDLSANVSVTAMNGGTFTVADSTDVLTDSIETVQVGSKLTLTASDSANFLKWEDENGKILGTEKALTITVMHDMSITMVCAPDEAATYVEFVGPYAQNLGSATYYAGNSLGSFPVTPAMLGHNFLFWSLDGETAVTAEDIEALFGTTESITITAVYEENTDACSIDVYVDGIKDETLSNAAVRMGENLALTAPTVDGKVFLYWSFDADGARVFSYDKACEVKSVSDVSVYAIYGDESELANINSIPTVIVLSTISEEVGTDKQHKVAVAVSRVVPDDYTLVECGMLYYKDGTYGYEDNMLLSNEEVMKYVGANHEANGTLTVHFNMTGNEDTTIYVRGYVVVIDPSNGCLSTIYTDIVAANYQA